MNRFWMRLRESIFPPKYPEYTEYRDEETASAPMSSEMETKIHRLRLAAGFVLILCLGVGAYLYTQDKDARGRTDLKGTLAAEALKEVVPEEQLQKPDSIDDIKRWAQQAEADAQRSLNDSSVDRSDSYDAGDMGSSRSRRSGNASGYDNSPGGPPPDQEYSTDAYDILAGSSTPVSSSTGSDTAPAGRTWSGPAPAVPTAYAASPPPARPPAPSAPPTASSGTTATAPPSSAAADTPAGRYVPRRYEPVEWQRREVEPY